MNKLDDVSFNLKQYHTLISNPIKFNGNISDLLDDDDDIEEETCDCHCDCCCDCGEEE